MTSSDSHTLYFRFLRLQEKPNLWSHFLKVSQHIFGNPGISINSSCTFSTVVQNFSRTSRDKIPIPQRLIKLIKFNAFSSSPLFFCELVSFLPSASFRRSFLMFFTARTLTLQRFATSSVILALFLNTFSFSVHRYSLIQPFCDVFNNFSLMARHVVSTPFPCLLRYLFL